MKKSFPCWVCRGKGTWVEVVIHETGQGPLERCGYCEGEGLIEIGGAIHRRIAAERIAIDIIKFVKPRQEMFTFEELQKLGNEALNLLQ